MSQFAIVLEGMDDIRKNLRAIDNKLGKELGQVHKRLGARIIAWTQIERLTMGARFGSYKSKRLKVKPSANQRRLLITIRPFAAESGIEAHPVFGRWVKQSRMKRRVWPPKKSTGGYLVAPVVERKAAQISDEYLDAVTKLIQSAIGE